MNKLTKEQLLEVIKIQNDLIKRIKNKRDAFKAIENYIGILTISFLTKFLGVSKGGYYKWLKTKPVEKYDKKLLSAIEFSFKKYRTKFGVRRIHVYLKREFGTNVNIKTVYRYMIKLNLKASIRIKKRNKDVKITDKGWDNLIKQQFIANNPSEKWFTDVSYIQTIDGWSYISAIIDTYNNEIIDWKFSNRNNNELVLSNLLSAVKKAKPGTIIIQITDFNIHLTIMQTSLITQNNPIYG